MLLQRGPGQQLNHEMAVQKILLVDDSRTESLVLSELLASAGYTVSSASNAAEAWNKLQTNRPDLIVLDVVMPGTNGFEFTRQLRRTPQHADIPIFLCSSKSLTSDKLWGMRQGAQGYFTKPVNASALLLQIQAIE